MPCFRGIEISFSLSPTNEKIPEFPHPEGPSVQILGPLHTDDSWSSHRPSTTASHRPSSSLKSVSTLSVGSIESIKYQKTDPRISVYIPSIPGLTFAINYDVTAKLSCKHIFFKLFMNGRPITSWGADLENRSKGKVVRSFWEPCERFQEQVGVEGRNFLFTPGQEKKSVADDGGLIEIKVFRAKNKRAQAPALTQFRAQSNYGIAAPSMGLIDRPEELLFYTFHLIDPKDQPYATFRFHYRSLENLRQLNIIPDTETIFFPSVTSHSRGSERAYGDNASISSGYSYKDASEAIVVQKRDASPRTPREDRAKSVDVLKSTPQLRPRPSLTMSLPQPSKALRDAHTMAYLQRPLPELPKDESCAVSRRSSMTSAASGAPSITRSLIDYVDNGSFEDDEVELGVAQLVEYSQQSSLLSVEVDCQAKDDQVGDVSVSDYDNSQSSEYNSDPRDVSRSRDSMTAQENKCSPSRHTEVTACTEASAPSGRVRETIELSGTENDHHRNRHVLGTLNLTESEWMRRTPSPTKERAASPAGRIWSPGLRARSRNEPSPGFLREEERGVDDSAEDIHNRRQADFRKGHRPPVFFRSEVDDMPGNWI